MARNRKLGYEGNRLVFGSVALGLIGASLAMVYLSLYNTCESIGRQIKSLEQEKMELQKQVVNEERNWAMARSIRRMEELMAHHGIVMTWPEERNIIRLRAAPATAAENSPLAGGLARRD